MMTALKVKDRVKLYPYKSKTYRINDFEEFSSLTVLVSYTPEHRGKLFFIEVDNNGNNLLLFVTLRKDALQTERSILTQRVFSNALHKLPVCIRLFSEQEMDFDMEIICW